MCNEEASRRSMDSLTADESNHIKLVWNCLTCNRAFPSTLRAMIASRNTSTKGCPYCAHTLIVEGESFGDVHPELLDEYAAETEIDPFEVYPNSKKEVLWRCVNDSEHTWKASFFQRHKGEAPCPVCNRTRLIKGINTFANVHPEYLDMYSENNERKADEIFYNTVAWLKWNCRTCHREFNAFVDDIVSGKPCPFCDGTKAILGVNSLQAMYPDIAKRYSSKNYHSPDEVLTTTMTDYIWDCLDCGNEYKASVGEVISEDYICPYCDERIAIPGVNSLQALYLDIAKRYSSKNYHNADEVLTTTSTRYLWNCFTCSNKYSAPVKDVISHNYVCPFCDGRLILPGFNDFATKHPDLMEEYNYAINYIITDPNNISEKSNDPLWWNCPKSPDHNYRMSPARKPWYQKRHRESCPFCKGLRRKKRHFI